MAACLRVQPPGPAAELQAETSFTDTLNQRVITVALQAAQPLTLAMSCGAPKGFYLDKILLNDKPLAVSRDNAFILSLKKSAVLKLVCKSLYLASPGDAFTKFQFVKDNKPAAAIVIPDKPSEEELFLAFRVQEYFRFYYANAVTPAVVVKLPIVSLSQAPTSGPRVLIGKAAKAYRDFWPWTSPARVRIGVDGDKLYITSKELCDAQLREGVYSLLQHLDKKYAYIGTIGGMLEGDKEKAMFEKAALRGKTLTIQKGTK